MSALFLYLGGEMDNIRFYEINAKYVDYLAPYAPHLFHNSKKGQANQRKYIGIVFQINDMEYFAPLSSFHNKTRENERGIGFYQNSQICSDKFE